MKFIPYTCTSLAAYGAVKLPNWPSCVFSGHLFRMKTSHIRNIPVDNESALVQEWLGVNQTTDHRLNKWLPKLPDTHMSASQQFKSMCFLAIVVYRVGSPFAGWSELFFFTAMQSGTDWSPRFAVYGDMGNVNAQSIPRLQDETERGHFDAILHVGKGILFGLWAKLS